MKIQIPKNLEKHVPYFEHDGDWFEMPHDSWKDEHNNIFRKAKVQFMEPQWNSSLHFGFAQKDAAIPNIELYSCKRVTPERLVAEGWAIEVPEQKALSDEQTERLVSFFYHLLKGTDSTVGVPWGEIRNIMRRHSCYLGDVNYDFTSPAGEAMAREIVEELLTGKYSE